MMLELKVCSTEGADFFACGYYALQLLVGSNDGDRTHETVRNDFNDIVAHYKLDAEALRELIESGWNDSPVDDALRTELVGRCKYRFSRAMDEDKLTAGPAFGMGDRRV